VEAKEEVVAAAWWPVEKRISADMAATLVGRLCGGWGGNGGDELGRQLESKKKYRPHLMLL
jgi:hypothetical protein